MTVVAVRVRVWTWGNWVGGQGNRTPMDKKKADNVSTLPAGLHEGFRKVSDHPALWSNGDSLRIRDDDWDCQ